MRWLSRFRRRRYWHVQFEQGGIVYTFYCSRPELIGQMRDRLGPGKPYRVEEAVHP